jgi:hypothetical protein
MKNGSSKGSAGDPYLSGKINRPEDLV